MIRFTKNQNVTDKNLKKMLDNPPALGPDDCLHVALTITPYQVLDSNMRKKGSNNFPKVFAKILVAKRFIYHHK
jgi:hypothetical protein